MHLLLLREYHTSEIDLRSFQCNGMEGACMSHNPIDPSSAFGYIKAAHYFTTTTVETFFRDT
jgi:hypothetical protein